MINLKSIKLHTFLTLSIFIFLITLTTSSSLLNIAHAKEQLQPSLLSSNLSCADFSVLSIGASVEGLGTVHPDLNISTSGNAVAIGSGQQPKAYSGPNGTNNTNILNVNIDSLYAGFSDIDKQHDYVFTFAPNKSINYLSLNMLDYGDINPNQATQHNVDLVAFNKDGLEVGRDTLAFTSDGQVIPHSGSAGDLWLTGDAFDALPGQPGNFTFGIDAAGITRVELQYSSNLGNGFTDPNFGLSSLCFSVEEEVPPPPTPPANTSCVEFNVLPVGTSVEGLGTVHPDLNISTSGNAVALGVGQQPKAYSGPNGTNNTNILNVNINSIYGGFSDIEKQHDYEFSFAGGTTIDFFTLNLLDYGDINPLRATRHQVSLVAFDTNNQIVDRDNLVFTSDGQVVPHGGSAGDLWLTGDAFDALPGQPGNYTFNVAGSGISRLELQYSSNLGAGHTDPNFGLSVLCFQPEETGTPTPTPPPPPPPPTSLDCANFNLVPVGSSIEGLGTVHPDLNISTSGNAVAIGSGQQPKAYSGPNGTNNTNILNVNIDSLYAGFSDIDKQHDYVFTFAPNKSINYLSLNMLDYGDINPNRATQHNVDLVAFNEDGLEVGRDTLAFTSDGQVIPHGGSAGDLWLTGDAFDALPGQPGNFTFGIDAAGITRVELQYSSNLGNGFTDPNFGLSTLCFSVEEGATPTPIPTNGTCADFNLLPVGASVEGLGTVHPDLNISTSGNAVALGVGQQPKGYSGPNGTERTNILNVNISSLYGGFSDIEKQHDYEFSFAQGAAVNSLTVNLLDYGDINPLRATRHQVSLVAFDTNNQIVDRDDLIFTSDGQVVPRNGSAGDLWLTGDAFDALPGQPGNYEFNVSGPQISRVELQFSSNLGAGHTDPNFGLSVLCFEPETTTTPPPTTPPPTTPPPTTPPPTTPPPTTPPPTTPPPTTPPPTTPPPTTPPPTTPPPTTPPPTPPPPAQQICGDFGLETIGTDSWNEHIIRGMSPIDLELIRPYGADFAIVNTGWSWSGYPNQEQVTEMHSVNSSIGNTVSDDYGNEELDGQIIWYDSLSSNYSENVLNVTLDYAGNGADLGSHRSYGEVLWCAENVPEFPPTEYETCEDLGMTLVGFESWTWHIKYGQEPTNLTYDAPEGANYLLINTGWEWTGRVNQAQHTEMHSVSSPIGSTVSEDYGDEELADTVYWYDLLQGPYNEDEVTVTLAYAGDGSDPGSHRSHGMVKWCYDDGN